MSITAQPALEAKLRERAKAAGISVEEYVERLVCSDEQAHDDIERSALEGRKWDGSPTSNIQGWHQYGFSPSLDSSGF